MVNRKNADNRQWRQVVLREGNNLSLKMNSINHNQSTESALLDKKEVSKEKKNSITIALRSQTRWKVEGLHETDKWRREGIKRELMDIALKK